MAGAGHLGRFIRECRTSVGYTSRQVETLTRDRADLAKISHTNLLAIENGKHVPTFDKVLTLSALYNVPTQYFEDQLRADMSRSSTATDLGTFEEHVATGNAALAEGRDKLALESYLHALALALTESPTAELQKRVIEVRLHAAQCRARSGLLRVAKEEIEELLALPQLEPSFVASACLYLSQIHRRRRNFRLSELFAHQALAAAEPGSSREATVLNALANTLDEAGEGARAEAIYHQALVVFDALGDHESAARVRRNLGTTHFRTGNYQLSIQYLTDGLSIAAESGDQRGRAFALANLVRAYYILERLPEAKGFARSAKDLAQEFEYAEVLFVALYYLWKIAISERQLALAQVYADRLSALDKKLETRCEESDWWRAELSRTRRKSQ